jgi:aminoglycoside phosphotransferase (APT) family kinase protein
MIRICCYQLLIKAGKRIYNRESAEWVHRLPFGLMVKRCIRAPRNEPNALRAVEKHTNIPAPRVVDVYDYQGSTFLVMTRLCGQQLGDVLHLMSYDERDRLADDLKNYVNQLRKIPNNTAYVFGDTLGGPFIDHRIPDRTGGPFNSEADFYNHLTSHLECTAAEAVGDLELRYNHRSFFTHSDFHHSNLLVECGRLSGIVDWECAGFKPEYWEFTKAMWCSMRSADLDAIFLRAFGNDFQSELEVERKLWRYTPFGV